MRDHKRLSGNSTLLLARLCAVCVVISIAAHSAKAETAQRGFQLASLNHSPAVIAQHARYINQLGGNLVRYPIYLAANGNLNAWISNLHTLFAETESLGMTVAVTFLWPDRNVQGSHIYDVPQFVSDWAALATALKNYKNVWYDLTNEPSNSNWSQIALQAAQQIRTVDQVHPIVYAIRGSSAAPVSSTYSPLPGISNQMLEVHFYDWLSMQLSSSTQYGTGSYTRSNMFNILSKVYAKAKAHGVRAYVGEVAINKDNPSAAAFLRDFTLFTSVLGLDLTVHAFREAVIWDYEQNPSAMNELFQWLDKYATDLDQHGSSDSIIWENATGTWHYRLSSQNFQTVHKTQWGLPGNKPFVGYFNSDNTPDFAVYQDPTFPPYWSVLYDYTKSWGQTSNYEIIQWGLPNDVPVAADYNGDGKTEIVVWRPSEGNWYVRVNASSYYVVQWGLSSDIPYPDDYDADGITDMAVWRTSNRRYYFIPSSGSCPSGTSIHGPGCEKVL